MVMGSGNKLSCILCRRSKETRITGPLSTKDSVTAHQNCLLYSSGIYCQNSPDSDDLFGFSVEDVMAEVKRGKRLCCDRCKKRGATAGCEVKRCKKSYHYPCAVQEGAENVEDDDKGKYGLYCYNHSLQRQKANGTINRPASSLTETEKSKKPSKATSSKLFCLDCKKKEESISLESLNNNIVMLYCAKHKPSSHHESLNGHDAVAGPSHIIDSNSSSSHRRLFLKRRLSLDGKLEETSSKCNFRRSMNKILDDSSSSDTGKDYDDLAMFAPLESDLDDSANSCPGQNTQEPRSIRNNAESRIASTSGNQSMRKSKEKENMEGDETEDSDEDSQSLLGPSTYVTTAAKELPLLSGGSPGKCPGASLGSTACPAGPQRGSTGRADLHPVHSESPLHTSSPILPADPENSYTRILLHSPTSSSSSPSPSPRPSSSCPVVPPSARPSVLEPSLDSVSFWKGCNKAGCTRAIFSHFICEMKMVFNRIQLDQASREDYDLALRVMQTTGNLTELVAKQAEELKKRQTELHRAATAMEKVMSALRR
ncbi:uncharacterized protein phf11 isoform 2-T2 [Polymixia lowei]